MHSLGSICNKYMEQNTFNKPIYVGLELNPLDCSTPHGFADIPYMNPFLYDWGSLSMKTIK